MASFSFAVGNARKIARIPLYAGGWILTRFIPRTSRTWVFGSGAGLADGGLALASLARERGEDVVWLVDSASDRRDAVVQGIPHVATHSFAGFWLTARARVVVVTHGFGDVNRYAVSGAFLVQLWHGIPLKRIGLDAPETLRSDARAGGALIRALLRSMYTFAARRIRLMPAASHLVRGRLESAFALAEGVVAVTGEPRVDVLSPPDPAAARADARARVAAATGADPTTPWVLYAPTWRDGDPDPAQPTAADRARIDAVLEELGATLLVRSHPLGRGDYGPETERVRFIGSDVFRDITPQLPAVDVLVTDYSSLVYDTALLEIPVVFFAPDVDEYSRRRGFYGSYAELVDAESSDTAPAGTAGGGAVATRWDDALAQLSRVLTDPAEGERRRTRARERSARVHAHRDGANTLRVYRAIRARQTGRPSVRAIRRFLR